jgi:GNAT superfamily N-acetyltransferase
MTWRWPPRPVPGSPGSAPSTPRSTATILPARRITTWPLLAVRPGQQGQGTGSMLLAAHHAALDRDRIPAYLEAASQRSRDLYLRHGYQPWPGAPYHLPGGGPPMWPMWRDPQP